jgi:hypothetical protein
MCTQSKRSLSGVAIALAALLGVTGQARAQFTFGVPENLGPVVNSSSVEGGPSISFDGLTLFFSSSRPGGFGSGDLWMAARAGTFGPWESPVHLGPTVNTAFNDGAPCISTDALTLFFQSNRPGGFGGWDLWMTTRVSPEGPWEAPVNLGPTVNSSSTEWGPEISFDGLTLFFSSTRPGGFGSWDLWMTTRASVSDPWSTPVNLGPTVNTSADDLGPAISPNGLTLFFASTRPGGLGGTDLWMTSRASIEDPWEPPVLLPAPVNTSSGDATPSISADGTTLFFRSDRPGGSGEVDLWQVAVTPTCVDRNGICEPGEDCLTCPPDCLGGDSLGCGNGACEPTLGEDCLSCPEDCNGKQNGNPSNRFCCGVGGYNPVSCGDPRCTSDGFDCSVNPVPSTCCGDGFCEGAEDSVNCGVDCGAGCSVPGDCNDSDPCTIDDCVGTVCVNDPIDCDDGNACTADSCSGGECFNDPIDCDDGDACTTDSCDPGGGCVNTFPACDSSSDGCCGPACNPGNDPDCPSCGAKNDSCTVDEDCCSLNCRPSGKCSG